MPESQRVMALRLLSVCGVIAPILYTIVVFTVGFLRPGYCHSAQFLSELGEAGAPNAVVMNMLGFSLLGVLLIAFAFGLHRGVSGGKGSRVGPALLAVCGGGYVAIGFFPCDPSCIPVSLSGVMHVWASLVVGISLILATFFFARRFKNDLQWKNYRVFTLAIGVSLLVVTLVLNFVKIEGWTGAIQRTMVGISLIWIEIVAIKLLRLSIPPSAQAEPL